MSVFVKICGVTSADDALACAEAGADAVGFNLWPRSRRYRPLDAFADAARAVRGRLERFGVFVDPSPAEVEAAFAADVIDVAQLHGDEDEAFRARFTGRAVKALRLAGAFSLDAVDRVAALAHAAGGPAGGRLLVDAPFAGYGGGGQLLDETLARAAIDRARTHGARVILAGGLDPDNVGGIVARLAPFGVDVATGVEIEPGRKDPERVRRFVRAARGAAGERA